MDTLLSYSGCTWSSYLNSDQFDLCDTFEKDFSIFNNDLFPIELPSSLHHDIKKIESSETMSDMIIKSEFDMDYPKVEIKNSDCMWSGAGLNNNTITTTTTTTNNTNDLNQTSSTYDNNGFYDHRNQPVFDTSIDIKPNVQNSQINQQTTTTTVTSSPTITIPTPTIPTSKLSMQNIPPGQSLLKNSRLNQENKNKNTKYNSIPILMTQEFLRDREQQQQTQQQQQQSTNLRPDTPISLDDDAPEFKHSVDVSACITGSNNICLNDIPTSDKDKLIINNIKEQLEDTTTNSMDLRRIPFGQRTKNSFTDVLNLIGDDNLYNNNETINRYNHHDENDGDDDDINDSTTEEESELEDDEFHTTQHLDRNNGNISSSSIGSSSSSNSSRSGINKNSCNINTNVRKNKNIFALTTLTPIKKQQQQLQNNYPMMLHSDHSYTRSKDGLEECVADVYGSILETPSDSDEEIDVVSVGDKKLPTNPSDKDRRVLQTKVAHKISARIVKTPNGIRTIPPRRSYDAYNSSSSSSSSGNTPSSPVKSLSTSRYPTPAPTPYSSYPNSVISVPTKYSIGGAVGSRKRNAAAAAAAAKDEYLPPSKRHRGKKIVQHQQKSANNSSSSNNNNSLSNKKQYNSSDLSGDADTIEKRNLHNDMERQRRIGLKNLFEALKKQIPSIKDKERAPKVNILREAAKLCEQLTREEKLLNNQKQQFRNQIQRREAVLLSLKSKMIKKEY